MGLTPRKRDQDEVAPAFGHFFCCPGAFIWEPCTPARQPTYYYYQPTRPTSTWSSSRSRSSKQHRNWNCRCCWHGWLCWRPPSSARFQCSWWPLWKIVRLGLLAQPVSNCETQRFTDQKLSSPIFTCCPASVTSAFMPIYIDFDH